MSAETDRNNMFFFIIGGLIVALVIFAYIYVKKDGHGWFGPSRPGIQLNITESGVTGTINTPGR